MTTSLCIVGFDSDEPLWSEISEILVIYSPKQTQLEEKLVCNGCLLTLNCILQQSIKKSAETISILNKCLNWLSDTKIK